MKTVAIIQARIGSTRLPDKIFADIGGEPMLGHVIRRARKARLVDSVIVATTLSDQDDRVEHYAMETGVSIFRGSQHDVLARYYHAATQVQADVIVRITADCPFIDPQVIDRIVSEFSAGNCDYASNTLIPTYPDGLDAEVFTMDSLQQAFVSAQLASEREHVTPYIKGHPELFRLHNVTGSPDLSGMRWTVDDPADLAFVRRTLIAMGRIDFGYRELAEIVNADPDLANINCGIPRDAGYARSLANDHIFSSAENA